MSPSLYEEDPPAPITSLQPLHFTKKTHFFPKNPNPTQTSWLSGVALQQEGLVPQPPLGVFAPPCMRTTPYPITPP